MSFFPLFPSPAFAAPSRPPRSPPRVFPRRRPVRSRISFPEREPRICAGSAMELRCFCRGPGTAPPPPCNNVSFLNESFPCGVYVLCARVFSAPLPLRKAKNQTGEVNIFAASEMFPFRSFLKGDSTEFNDSRLRLTKGRFSGLFLGKMDYILQLGNTISDSSVKIVRSKGN